MPELPEVETTRRGIAPYVLSQTVERVLVREPRLRWPVSPRLARELSGQRIDTLERRAKYLLLGSCAGTLIMHLGMSGSLRVVSAGSAPRAHDHLDIVLAGPRETGQPNTLRFHDPRRFGAAVWTRSDPLRHRLIRHLGPEPLGESFDGAWLFAASRARKASIKTFIMDARVVVGVGNIYASEALFLAGIHPRRPAGRVSAARYGALSDAIKRVLGDAIESGGTTLRDYVREDGSPGYFALHLRTYGREGEPCERCGSPIRREVIGQRSSFYCVRCQR